MTASPPPATASSAWKGDASTTFHLDGPPFGGLGFWPFCARIGGLGGGNPGPMFERYTERARRVIFFARYEASQLGSNSIETEHLLLGLIREGKGLTSRIFARSHLSLENIRKEIEGRALFREKVSTSVEIPFSAETKRVLQFAAEEADRLLHNYIGTEHLLLGILREERSVAASILMEKGMRLNAV